MGGVPVSRAQGRDLALQVELDGRLGHLRQLGALVRSVLGEERPDRLAQGLHRVPPGMGRAAQALGELGREGRAAESAGGRLEGGAGRALVGHRALQLERLDGARLLAGDHRLPAHPELGEGGLAGDLAPGELELVEAGHLVARADLAGVHRVVAEVAVGDGAVLVAELAPADDLGRVELHLDLHVPCDGDEAPDKALDDRAPGVGGVAHVVAHALAAVRELLEEDVVVVRHPHPDGVQEDAAAHAVGDLFGQALLVRLAQVGDAVGEEDHAGLHPLQERHGGEGVAQLQAGLGVGAAAGLQGEERRLDGVTGRGGGGRQRLCGVLGEAHDGDGVAAVQLPHQQADRVLHELEAVPLAHGARGVDHEGQRQGRPRVTLDLPGTHAQAQEPAVLPPPEGRRRELGVEGEGPVFRSGQVGLRGVDELLGPDLLAGRQEALP